MVGLGGPDPFEAILSALGLPAAQVQGAIGPYLEAARRAGQDTQGQPLERRPGGQQLPVGYAQAVQNQLPQVRQEVSSGQKTGQQQFQAGLDPLPFPAQFAATAMTDPLSYVGWGLPGKAASGLRAAAPASKIAQRAAVAFDYLQKADAAATTLPWDVAKESAGAVSGVLGSIPVRGALKYMDQNGGLHAAKTLGEWASQRSASSWFKTFGRSMENVHNTLLEQGRNLGRDLIDQANFQSTQPVIDKLSRTSDLRKAVNTGFGVLRGEILKLPPAQQAYGLEVAHHVNTLVQDAFDRAVQAHMKLPVIGKTAVRGKDLYSDNDYKVVIPGLYSRAAFEATQAIKAGLRAINTPPAHLDTLVLRDPAAVSDTVRKTFNEVHATQQIIGKILNSIPRNPVAGGPAAFLINERNKDINAAFTNGSAMVHSITGATPQDIKIPALQKVSEGLSMAKAVEQGKPAITAYLPADTHALVTREWPNVVRFNNALKKDRNTVEDALKTFWDNHNPGQPFPGASLATTPPDQRYPLINQILGTQGIDNPIKLLDALRPEFVADVPRMRKIQNALTHWEDGDFVTGDPYQLALSRVIREKAWTFGIGKGNDVNKVLGRGTSLWKTAQLPTLTYLVTNTLSGLLAGGLEGVNATQTTKHLAENISTAWSGRQVVNSNLRNFNAATGLPVPVNITAASGGIHDVTAVKDFLGSGVDEAQRMGGLKLGALGAGLGAASGALEPDVAPEDRGKAVVTNAAVGGVLGATLPLRSKYLLQRLGAGVEATLRQDAYLVGVTHALEGQLDTFTQTVAQELARTTPRIVVQPGTGLRAISGSRGSPTFIKSATDALIQKAASKGGLLSEADVFNTLARQGVAPETARGLATQWRDVLSSSQRVGVDLAAKIHVDYADLNNIQDFAKKVFPFATWAMKMTPFFAQHLLERPAVLINIMRLNEMSGQYNERHGLTQRFEGAVPLGLGDMLFGFVTGHPQMTYTNLLRGFVPFSDTSRSLGQAEQSMSEGNPVGAGLEALGAFGLSPHPLVQIGARMLNNQDPARGYIRSADPARFLESLAGMNNGTGYDLNAVFTQPERVVRGLLHGEQPPDLRQSEVLRRIDEMALGATGHSIKESVPEVAPYQAAKAQQSGPVWDEAAKDVERTRGLQSMLGYLYQGLSPQAVANPEEMQMRQAQVDARSKHPGQPELQAAVSAIIQTQGPDLPAPPAMIDQARTIIRQYGVTGDQYREIFKLLDEGTAGDVRQALDLVIPRPVGAEAGYSAAGGPTESSLRQELAVWANPAATMTEKGVPPEQVQALVQFWDAYQKMNPTLQARIKYSKTYGGILKSIQDARDSYRAANPLLDEYLAYKDANGGNGAIDDFLNRRKSGVGR